MTEIKNDKELLVELRNKIAGRWIEFEANAEYWGYKVRHAKHDSQEIVSSRKNAEDNEKSAKEDKIFLKCIDLMLKKQK